MQEGKRTGKYKNLLKDSFVFLLGSMGTKLIQFLLVPIYTNALSKAEYGNIDLIFTIVQLIMPFTSLVIFDAVLRFGLKKDVERGQVLKDAFAVLAAGSVCMILFTPFIGLYPPIAEWKWFACANVIISMTTGVLFSYLKVKNMNRVYALLSVNQTFMSAVFSILALLVFHQGIKGYLTAGILSHLMTLILLLICGDVYKDVSTALLNKSLLKQMVGFSAPLIITNVSWWVIQSSDKIMVERMLGLEMLGLYSVAAKIPALINVVISVFQQAWGISAIKEYEDSNETSFYDNVFQAFTTFVFGVTILFISIIRLFMKYYVAAEYYIAWRYTPLLLMAAAFSATSSYYASMYSALQKSVNNMLTTLTAAVMNIILNFILIKRYGVCGAVTATAVSYFVMSEIRKADVGRYIHIKIYKTYSLNCILLIVQAILVSLAWHTVAVSAATVLLYLFVNQKQIRRIAVDIKHRKRSRWKKK